MPCDIEDNEYRARYILRCGKRGLRKIVHKYYINLYKVIYKY